MPKRNAMKFNDRGGQFMDGGGHQSARENHLFFIKRAVKLLKIVSIPVGFELML